MDSFSLFLAGVITVYLIVETIDLKLRRIHIRIRERHFALKYPRVNKVMRIFLKCLAIFLLHMFVLKQEEMKFIRVPNSCDPIVLVVAIYTMYGIFIAFIQFLNSFSSSNARDRFWGRSKTKTILMDSTEHRFLNSTIFRILIIYLSIYSVFDFSSIPFTEFASIQGYAEALFWVGVFLAILEFAMLFLKVIEININLFWLQENGSRINSILKIDIQNEFFYMFEESVKSHDNYFVDALFMELETIDETQREDMLYSIVCHTYRWYEDLWGRRSNKILLLAENLLRLSFKDDKTIVSINFKNLITRFWDRYQQCDVILSFDRLLRIYQLQDGLMFSLLEQEAHGDYANFSSKFEIVYEKRYCFDETLSFLDYTPEVWDGIKSVEQLVKIMKNARSSAVFKALDKFAFEEEEWYPDKFESMVIATYSSFLMQILDRGKLYVNNIEKEVETLFNLRLFKDICCENHSNNLDQNLNDMRFGDRIHTVTKNTILTYVKHLENVQQNKKYIEILLSVLETKYIITYIIFKMLYTGSDHSGWKKEVMFFKEIYESRSFKDDSLGTTNIDFVKFSTSNSDIGHRISEGLIGWIFNNINASIDEKLVRECKERRYMSYAIYIVFRYIFGNDRRVWLKGRTLELENLVLNDDLDWRIECINDLSKLPGVMEVSFFREHIYDLFDFGRRKVDVGRMLSYCRYEAYFMVGLFIRAKDILAKIDDQPLMKDDAYSFLLIKLSEFGEVGISSLLPEARRKLSKKYDDILTKSLQSADEYVGDLCTRSSAVGYEIPPHRKEKAISIVRTMIA